MVSLKFPFLSGISFPIFFLSALLVLINSCKNTESQSISVEQRKDTFTTISANVTPPFDMSIFKKDGTAYELPWKYLMSVHFEEEQNEKLGMEVSVPIFSDTLLALNNREVIVEGYFIPVEETGDENIVILSAFPYSQCFFCGKAGIESIIDVVKPKSLPRMKMDKKVKFKGRFKLNKDNFDFLIYLLEDARLVE